MRHTHTPFEAGHLGDIEALTEWMCAFVRKGGGGVNRAWRTMYLDLQPPHSLHSVVLVGIQNIARLNFGRSSPFNIAFQHRLEDFSLDEVRDLLGQYTSAETGQAFAPSVFEKVYEQTAGGQFIASS